jgi:IclR family pca regulon transcriptional regulator
LSVLKVFNTQDRPLSVTEVADLVGIPRTAVRRFILTLEHLGYISFNARGYSLRPAVLELGDAYLRSHTLPEVAHPHLDALVHEIGETASLTVLHRSKVIYIDRVHADRVLTVNIIIGTSVPAYATATGRVLLAGLDDETVDKYLKTISPESLTERTAVERSEIKRRVAVARESGWSLADQELTPGLRSIAVPVQGPDGQVIAAINVSAAASRVSAEALRTSILPKLQKAGACVARDLADEQH